MSKNTRGAEVFQKIDAVLNNIQQAIQPGCRVFYSTHITKKPQQDIDEAQILQTIFQKNAQKLVYNYLLLTLNGESKLYWITPTANIVIDKKDLNALKARIPDKADDSEPDEPHDNNPKLPHMLASPLELKDELDCESILGKHYQQTKHQTILDYQQHYRLGRYNVPSAFVSDSKKHHTEIKNAINERAKKRYAIVLEQLQLLNKQEDAHKLRSKIAQLIEQIEAIKKAQPLRLAELTLILESTYQLIDPEQTTHIDSPHVKAYMHLAKRTQGCADGAMQALGTSMMVIGSFMMLYGGIILTLAFFPSPIVWPLLYLGAAFAVPGVIITPLGGYFFAKGQCTGLSKTMHEIEHEVAQQLTPQMV